MTLSALVLSITMNLSAHAYIPETSNEGQVNACVQTCIATYDKPDYQLKACVAKCQELARP